MLIFLILLLSPALGFFTDELKEADSSFYFYLSRSVTLYILLIWYTFMYISMLNFSRKESPSSIRSQQLSMQRTGVRPELLPPPLVQEPVAAPIEDNRYPLLGDPDYESNNAEEILRAWGEMR